MKWWLGYSTINMILPKVTTMRKIVRLIFILCFALHPFTNAIAQALLPPACRCILLPRGYSPFAYKDELADSIVHDLIPDTASYSLLFAYRLLGGVGSLICYQLNVDDSEVALTRLGSAYVVKLDKPGRTKLWARTKSEKAFCWM